MWCSLNVQEVERKLKTNVKFGLSEEEARTKTIKIW